MRDDALFAQEQWTLKRLTLQGALRFDRAWSYFGAVQEGPSRFVPVPLVVPRDERSEQLQGSLAENGGDLRCIRER